MAKISRLNVSILQAIASMGIISLILAIAVFIYEQKTARFRVIEKIQEKNWYVIEDGELPEDPISEISFRSHKLTDSHFDVLTGISRINTVFLDHVKICDGAFKQFPRDCEIGYLNLEGSSISDQELCNLSGLTIRELHLNETNITGSSIGSLARCPGLSKLNISNCDLDESILVEEIRKLPELQFIILSENSLSVQTIQRLIDIPNIQKVGCYSNDVSLENVVLPPNKYLYWQD